MFHSNESRNSFDFLLSFYSPPADRTAPVAIHRSRSRNRRCWWRSVWAIASWWIEPSSWPSFPNNFERQHQRLSRSSVSTIRALQIVFVALHQQPPTSESIGLRLTVDRSAHPYHRFVVANDERTRTCNSLFPVWSRNACDSTIQGTSYFSTRQSLASNRRDKEGERSRVRGRTIRILPAYHDSNFHYQPILNNLYVSFLVSIASWSC